VGHEEVADSGIEHAGLERQSFGFGEAELDRRMQPAGQPDHCRGDIHANHRGAPIRSFCSRVPRARRNIEDPGAALHPRGI
jgi:hypothetical protein